MFAVLPPHPANRATKRKKYHLWVATADLSVGLGFRGTPSSHRVLKLHCHAHNLRRRRAVLSVLCPAGTPIGDLPLVTTPRLFPACNQW